ncbi:MAG: flagellar hook-length control protein FliK [Acidimicrobiales bacterium]|nr:flagellar hook-length control protein FliK [Hyphomonadaceae bacterium]RZV44774.1 MAG: flagellar hook-length control protein FliK [Acidimicrobiales bacterium]
MLFPIEIPASTSAKNKTKDPEIDPASPGDIAVNLTANPNEDAEQFFSAFDALAIDELSSSEGWDFTEAETVHPENTIDPEYEQALILGTDVGTAAPISALDKLIKDTPSSAIPHTEKTGKTSAPIAVTSPSTPHPVQPNAQNIATPVEITTPANDTANPDDILFNIASRQVGNHSDGETPDHTIGNKRPGLDIKANTDGANPAAQIKWDNASTKIPENLERRGLETAEVKSASSNGKSPAPVLITPITGMQIAPLVSNAPDISTPIAMQVDIAQHTQKSAPSQQLAQALATVTQDQNKLQVRLDPPELGRVTVEFQFDGNRGVTAVISAENADIGSQLRDRSEFLLKSLRLAGFGNIDLSFDTQSNLAQNGSDLSKDKESHAIAIYETDNQMIELDGDGTVTRQLLSVPEDNLNILL